MRITKLLFSSAISALAVLSTVALTVRCNLNPTDLSHASDAVLEANFQQHEADLEVLLDISDADKHVVRISNDFTWLENNAAWPRPESELGFSSERWDTYRRIFKKIGLEGGIARERNGEVTYFISSNKGLVTHGTQKGYAFGRSELAPTAESLDDFDRLPKGHGVVFKKLKPHWYLFYMSA